MGNLAQKPRNQQRTQTRKEKKRQRREEARRPDAPSEPPSPVPARTIDLKPLLRDLLHEVGQTRVYGWNLIDETMIRNMVPMTSGSYGTVFSSKFQRSEVVVKVVLVSQIKTSPFHGVPDLEFVRNEVMILSHLKRHQTLLANPGAVQVIDLKFVRGQLPEKMREEMGDEPPEQLYFVSVTKNEGIPISRHRVATLYEFKCILAQLLVTLVKMERDIQFEHRDMHYGNILVRESNSSYINFGSGEVASGGVKVTLIDFTYSRATINGCRYFVDLDKNESLFPSHPNLPKEFARVEMRRRCGGRWADFNEGSNGSWIKMIGEELIRNTTCQCSVTLSLMTQWLEKLVEAKTVENMVKLHQRDIIRL